MVPFHLLRPQPTVAPAAGLVSRVVGVMGGRPIVRGTRITVAAVKGRIVGGDRLDDLVADHPEVAREAFAAAIAYDAGAQGHPVRSGTRRSM